MKYARVVNNIVTEVVDRNPRTIFHPTVARMFIEATDEVKRGWTYSSGEFTAPPVEVVVEEVEESANTAE